MNFDTYILRYLENTLSAVQKNQFQNWINLDEAVFQELEHSKFIWKNSSYLQAYKKYDLQREW